MIYAILNDLNKVPKIAQILIGQNIKQIAYLQNSGNFKWKTYFIY